jgi:hypothetical protein
LIYFTTGVIRGRAVVERPVTGRQAAPASPDPGAHTVVSISAEGLQAIDCHLDPNLLVQTSRR